MGRACWPACRCGRSRAVRLDGARSSRRLKWRRCVCCCLCCASAQRHRARRAAATPRCRRRRRRWRPCRLPVQARARAADRLRARWRSSMRRRAAAAPAAARRDARAWWRPVAVRGVRAETGRLRRYRVQHDVRRRPRELRGGLLRVRGGIAAAACGAAHVPVDLSARHAELRCRLLRVSGHRFVRGIGCGSAHRLGRLDCRGHVGSGYACSGGGGGDAGVALSAVAPHGARRLATSSHVVGKDVSGCSGFRRLRVRAYGATTARAQRAC